MNSRGNTLDNESAMLQAAEMDAQLKTMDLVHANNPMQKEEFAKNLAFAAARLSVNSIVRTRERTYRVLRKVDQNFFGYTYEVKEKGGRIFFLRTEPLTANNDMTRFKTLKYDLMILKGALKAERSATGHFPRFHDSGCTDDFKFLVSQPLGETLFDITRSYMNNKSFTMPTALRVAIQMLRAIGDLHGLDFIHRFIRPQSFSIGLGSKIRTIYFADFGMPFMYREHKTKRVRFPRKKGRSIGSLRYMSRNSQLKKELGRRDDLESWAYLSLEFFNLDILPWRDDQLDAEVLAKKQKLIGGAYPMIFVLVTLKYKQILRYIATMKYSERPDYSFIQQLLQEIRVEKKLDFSQPYDWEALNLRSIIVKDSVDGSNSRDHTPVKSPRPAVSPKVVAKSPKLKPKSPAKVCVKTPKKETGQKQSKGIKVVQPISLEEDQNDDSSSRVSSVVKKPAKVYVVHAKPTVAVSSVAKKPPKVHEFPMVDKLIDVEMVGVCENLNDEYCELGDAENNSSMDQKRSENTKKSQADAGPKRLISEAVDDSYSEEESPENSK